MTSRVSSKVMCQYSSLQGGSLRTLALVGDWILRVKPCERDPGGTPWPLLPWEVTHKDNGQGNWLLLPWLLVLQPLGCEEDFLLFISYQEWSVLTAGMK